MEYKKVDQNINNIVNEQVRKLESIFPSVVKDGEVDFDALKEELGQFQKVENEKYEITWAGKKNAKKLAQENVVGRTLNFYAEESKNVETTENVYIEGDNLEVLKMLRQNYYGAIKIIYIDPPYNTGKDFIYNDIFKMNKKESDLEEGVIGELGQRLVINSKSQNRYHAKWLNMIYPRLVIAKDLLSEQGVIFISIDYHEAANLKKLCDEIFGEDCFVCNAIWRSSDNSNNDAKQFSYDHNETLIYSKSVDWMPQKQYDEKKQKHFKNPDNDPKGPWFDGNPLNSPNYRENLKYDIKAPNGTIIKPPKNGWRWSKETLKQKMDTGEIYFNADQTNIKRRTYLRDMKGLPPSSLWIDFEKTGHNRQAKYELLEEMPENIFDTPKPTKLIKYIINLVVDNKEATILDFFSGSGTTADAIMQLNAEDGGKRKFILVQLPEDLDKGLEKASNDNKTTIKNAIGLCEKKHLPHKLSEIAKERIRRVGEKIKQEFPENDIDDGFKVFKTSDTNIKWNSLIDMGQLDVTQIENSPELIDFIPGADDVNIVYELMLRQRDLPLSESLVRLSDLGKRTYLYASSYLVCLETEITEELVSKLSELDPLPIKFIFRDSALKDETFRRLKALIEKNAGTNKPAYTVEFI